jgi:excinuclease ABC subunit A
VKLATELAKKDTGKTLYVLDEPTTGLHFEDIRILMDVLQKLTNRGNTVIIIEHNMDVIKLADYIIDVGPEGGRNGGMILATGTPEEIVKSNKGYTPRFLKQVLEKKN